ncbi:hypothetical protein HG263_05460 [Pseudoalteromonas sp. JBTF-M23]|uniref:Head decoration protein n=1 Tax=Pseudoalteromonas caenipelagi TaxID=2726988 RepID=A0A849VBM9_9GAMM|nr:hypothetical protein [Pseudoalteromonas caenipelagi]NOU49983.1 hypothetical protein [Pseudoalteromonas caenipelagi]
MMTTFNLGSVAITQKSIVEPSHPPIIRNRRFATGKGVIPAGTVVAENGADLVTWDGTNGTIEGVATENVDTDNAETGPVIEHGVAVREHVLVNSNAITPAQELKLKAAGIWLS